MHSLSFDHIVLILIQYSVSILSRENNERKRKILEMLHIIKNVHAVNFKTDTARARSAYRSVIANCE